MALLIGFCVCYFKFKAFGVRSVQPKVGIYHYFTEHFAFYLWSDLLILPTVYLHIYMAL